MGSSILMSARNNRFAGEQSLLFCCLYTVAIISKPTFVGKCIFLELLELLSYFSSFSMDVMNHFRTHNIQSKG